MEHKLENLVELQRLGFKRQKRVILENINFKARRGKITAIMGPSGSGKTTILRLIGGQLLPDAGTVHAFGESIPRLDRTRLYKVRRRMGMLFQSGALFSDLNVFENVAYPIREHTNLPEFMIRDLVLMKLQAVGLRGALNLMPGELSGGMSRRVALARALALDPELLMFDEPFAGQDPITMGILVKLIRLLNDALGLTTIIVSHDVQETMSIADYIYLIAEGKIVGEGTPETLLSQEGKNLGEKYQNGNPQESMDPKSMSQESKYQESKRQEKHLESKNQRAQSFVQQFLHGLPDGPVPFHYPAKDYQEDLWEYPPCFD